MSDTERIFRRLLRGPVTTEELRKEGFSGNPSQRKADIEKRYGVEIEAELFAKGKRRYSRYTLVGVGAGAGTGGNEIPTPASADSSELEDKPGTPVTDPEVLATLFPDEKPKPKPNYLDVWDA